MGGRGASLGSSYLWKGKEHTYSDEYKTLFQSGNIKFITPISGSASTPLETKTRGRIYVTINARNNIKAITYYDKSNKKYKQIDVTGNRHKINGKLELPHTQLGYDKHNANEKSTRVLTPKEKKMIDRVIKSWNYYLSNRSHD